MQFGSDGRVALNGAVGAKPVAIDLFAGAGGATLGLRHAGFAVPVAVEIDKTKAAYLKLNNPATRVIGTNGEGDIRSLSSATILHAAGLSEVDIDLVVGCPPCQGFSLLGNREPEDERNVLFRDFLRIGLEIGPSVFVFENVPGILSLNGGSALRELKSGLEKADYRTGLWDLNAADYGVPQMRRRLFMIAVEGEDLPVAPSPSPRSRVSTWDAIADMPESARKTRPPSTVEVPYAGPAVSAYARRLRGSRRSVSNCEVTVHSAELKARFAELKSGDADEATWHRRLDPRKPAPTITAGTRTRTACRPVHPFKNRVLTVREAARLTGFPDWYEFPPTISEAWQEIGNSVPPPLAARVFASLKDLALSGRRPVWDRVPSAGVAGSRYVEQGPPTWTERRLRSVVRLLSRTYRNPRHHNKVDPLDELVFIVLSAKTTEASYLKTFDAIKSVFPSWDAALASQPGEIERAIARGGLARKKGAQIRRLLSAISDANGTADLGFLQSLPTDRVEELLASLPGVGKKSAKCVAMYSLGRPSFPVDTHVKRALMRLGIAKISRLDDRAQDHLESAIPPDLRYKLHVNAIALGRELCLPRDPICPACPVSGLCDFARGQARAGSASVSQAAFGSTEPSSAVRGLTPRTTARSATALRKSVFVLNSPRSQRSRNSSRSAGVSQS